MTSISDIHCLYIRVCSVRGGYPLRIVVLTMMVLLLHPASWGAEKDDGRIWQVGYYAWDASYQSLETETVSGRPLPLLYVKAGEVRTSPSGSPCRDSGDLGMFQDLPAAEKYVAVVRIGDSHCPDGNTAQWLATAFRDLKGKARMERHTLAGLQIDYDCPTRHLAQYARFLGELRNELSKEDILSITALLDWFRPGSGVADVIRQVDEFVPQFYDVAPERSGEKGAGVARLIEPGWGTIFNAYGKPYRIAIASFGRMVEVSGKKGKKRDCASGGVSIIDDPPLEFLAKNRLTLKSKAASRAGERLISFTYPRANKKPCPEHEPGDVVKMIIPTRTSVSRAYEAALKMGPWCRGVLFFRWPVRNEAMVFSQSELERIMADKEPSSGAAPGLEKEDGICVAVNCVDLLLRLRDRFPEKPVKVRISSSLELEYFLPDEDLKTRVIGPRTIEATIPAYAGVPEIRLGRAVTRNPAEFRVEEMDR